MPINVRLRRPANRAFATLAALILVSPVGAQSATPAIPRPDLSAMQPAPRTKIEQMQQVLADLERNPEATAVDRATAFTFLGQLFHAFNQLDAAKTCYSAATELFPDDTRSLYLRGLVYNAQGDFTSAIADYRRAATLQPNVLEVQLRLGDALLESGDREGAIAAYEHVISLSEESAAAHFGLGRALATADPERAAASLERALALQPDASIVHYPLSQIYRRLGHLAKAEEHAGKQGGAQVKFADPLAMAIAQIARSTAFEVMADLAADESTSDRDFFGFVLSQFGDVPGSVPNIEKLLENLGNDEKATPFQRARLHYALGGMYAGARQDDAARPHFERAIELAPKLGDARVKLGNLIARSGDLDTAIGHFSEALTIDPDDLEALMHRSSALVAGERYEEAERDLRRALGLQPQSADVRLRLGNVFERRGRAEEAAAEYDRAAELASSAEERARVESVRAAFFARSGRTDEAVAALRKAVAEDPGNVQQLSTLAGLLGQLGRYRESSAVYRQWVELQPQAVQPRVGEATALILGNEHAAARDRLEQGRKDLPDSLDLLDLLARHLVASPEQSVRDGKKGLELAQQLFDRYPSAQSLETLAMAYAQAGQFEEARSRQQQLIDRGREEASLEDLERWQKNLSRYERGETCCAE